MGRRTATVVGVVDRNRVARCVLAAMLTVGVGVVAGGTPAGAVAAPVTIEISLDQSAIRADGLAGAAIQIDASVTASGAPLAGAKITLRAVWSTPKIVGAAKFAPAAVVLDGAGHGSSVVTSTRSGALDVVASIHTASHVGTASVPLTTTRHSMVVFASGAGSVVTCSSPTVCSDPSGIFNPVRNALAAQGFQPDDLPTFSYAGGVIDPVTRVWIPKASTCAHTAGTLKSTVGKMRTMLRKIGSANPNTDISVVGLSLGGITAFQMVDAVATLPKGSRLAAIVSLDGPIGGAPTSLLVHLEPFANTSCFSAGGTSKAAVQLNAVWDTTAPGQGPDQADHATLMCALVGVTGCVLQSNQAAVAAAPNVVVQTWGSSNDGVFDPAVCGFGGFPDAIDTQVVTGAGGGLHDEGLFGGPSCTIFTHIAVVANRAADIAATVGPQQ
jgi:hypothetical protein